MAKKYEMPAAKTGQIVYWHMDSDSNSDPSAAIVTQTGESGVSLAIVLPDSYNLQPVSGVPHVTDPRVAKLLDVTNGSWQHISEWEEKQAPRSSPPPESDSNKTRKSEAMKL